MWTAFVSDTKSATNLLKLLSNFQEYSGLRQWKQIIVFFIFKVDGRAPLREVQCPPTDSLIQSVDTVQLQH